MNEQRWYAVLIYNDCNVVVETYGPFNQHCKARDCEQRLKEIDIKKYGDASIVPMKKLAEVQE